MMSTADRRTPIDSILDGLEYLVAEALRTRRSDLAEELVKALHAIAEIEERRATGPHTTLIPLRLLPPPRAPAVVGARGGGRRVPDHDPSGQAPSNIIHIHGSRQPARGLQLCLEQLRQEAVAFRLTFVAHLIGIASEAARQEADRAVIP